MLVAHHALLHAITMVDNWSSMPQLLEPAGTLTIWFVILAPRPNTITRIKLSVKTAHLALQAAHISEVDLSKSPQLFQDFHGTQTHRFALKLALPLPIFHQLLTATPAQDILMIPLTACAINVTPLNTLTPTKLNASHAQLSLLAAVTPKESSESAVVNLDTLLMLSTSNAINVTPVNIGIQHKLLAKHAQTMLLAAQSQMEFTKCADALKATLLMLSTKYAI